MFECSNVQMFKCQMSNDNKVKLLSELTSGVPPVIFNILWYLQTQFKEQNQLSETSLTKFSLHCWCDHIWKSQMSSWPRHMHHCQPLHPSITLTFFKVTWIKFRSKRKGIYASMKSANIAKIAKCVNLYFQVNIVDKVCLSQLLEISRICNHNYNHGDPE